MPEGEARTVGCRPLDSRLRGSRSAARPLMLETYKLSTLPHVYLLYFAIYHNNGNEHYHVTANNGSIL